jgi:hypothetical protein
MPCSICKKNGHNRRTCKNMNTVRTVNNSTECLKNKKCNSSPCAICLSFSKYKTNTRCGHTFCSKCIFKNISFGNFNCPLCRKVLVRPKKYFKKYHKHEIVRLTHKIQILKNKIRLLETKCILNRPVQTHTVSLDIPDLRG